MSLIATGREMSGSTVATVLRIATRFRFGVPPALSAILIVAMASVIAGCGSGGGPAGSSGNPPPAEANSTVTVVLSGTANDQLSEFDIEFQSITLTGTGGKTVTLLSQSQTSEFIHVNGTTEPLLTVTVPQDVYTAATVVVGGAQFTCVSLNQLGGIDVSEFAYGVTPSSNVSVTLPAPITVSGDSMGLVLTMLVSQSASYSNCQGGGSGSTYAITPTFSLTPLALSTQPTTAANGAVTSLDGQVSALDTGSTGFQLLLPVYLTQPATTLRVNTNNATVWQGIASFAALAAGTFVDLDGAIQADGSLLATRIAVEDSSAVDVQRGPILFVSNSSSPVMYMDPRQEQGMDRRVDMETFNFGSATFQISGQLNNVQTLPFTPSFAASNMVPGQSVYISSPAFLLTGSYLAVATTITLMPQTINATVVGSSTSGNFTVYNVALGAYDPFPSLAVQPGQTALLTDPNNVEVYVDSQTLMLNSSAPAVGNTLRFYGLVFNDNGTLRMDCAQISDGVTI
jgi:hypothetical protein